MCFLNAREFLTKKKSVKQLTQWKSEIMGVFAIFLVFNRYQIIAVSTPICIFIGNNLIVRRKAKCPLFRSSRHLNGTSFTI